MEHQLNWHGISESDYLPSSAMLGLNISRILYSCIILTKTAKLSSSGIWKETLGLCLFIVGDIFYTLLHYFILNSKFKIILN